MKLNVYTSLIIASMISMSHAVELKPAPVIPVNVSSINGAEMALKAWDAKVRKDLHAYMKGQPEIEVFRTLTAYEVQNELMSAKELTQLNKVFQPLLERFANQAKFQINKLSAEDKAVVYTLSKRGIYLTYGEGSAALALKDAYLFELIVWGKETGDVSAVFAQMPQRYVADGGLCLTVAELGNLAIKWEKVISPGMQDVTENFACNQYQSIMDLMLWCDMPNTPAFDSRAQGGKMKKDWRKALESFIDAAPKTKTAQFITEYLKLIDNNSGKITQELRERVRTHIRKTLTTVK